MAFAAFAVGTVASAVLLESKYELKWKSKGMAIAASAVGTQAPAVYLATSLHLTAPAVIPKSK